MSNLDAYVNLDIICEPIKQRDTNFICAASGAVDQLIGQHCKQSELRVFGSSCNNNKINYLIKKLNFDAAFKYKKYDDLALVFRQNFTNDVGICFVM
ncbi:hypothetical protein K502DRAFT_116501 [Neoconidiobolus thromboides FSU 785]|nr:hypothetical protein K502DRAFT_116501 [Neoconidiobolus thromboides FSU 785]